MSTHIPENFPSRPPPSAHANQSIENQQNAEEKEVKKKDILEASLINEASSSFLTPDEVKPTLSNHPLTLSSSSIMGSFKTWNEAIRAFRNQLKASSLVNVETRRRFNSLITMQAREISTIMAEKEKQVARLEKELQAQLDGFNQTLQEMQQIAQDQQNEIDQINAGNGQEKEEYAHFTDSYDQYVTRIKQISVMNQKGDFPFPEAPPEKVQEYNAITQEYQQATARFQEYWQYRFNQISQYNAKTISYNQQVAEYNKTINEFISQHHLYDFIRQQGIEIPQLTQASRRDFSELEEKIEPIRTFSTYPLSLSYVKSIAQAGPSAIPKLSSFPPFNPHILFKELYQIAYEKEIVPLDQALMQYHHFNAFINRNIANIDQELDKKLSSEALLNHKAFSDLFPLPPSKSSCASSLLQQWMELEDIETQNLLGNLLIKDILREEILKELKTLSQKEREIKLAELTEKILLLSVGLMANQSLQALFPSLGMLSETLASLPKDSPAFAILFAVSLINRMGEEMHHALSREALESFLDSIPELRSLSSQAKKELAISLNIGQLLVASKLLEESLGLSGLFVHLLPSLSSIFNPQQMIAQAKQEDENREKEILTEIQQQFVAKRYSEDTALFFAQVTLELLRYGPLAPSATANISEQTIDQSLLKNSLIALLALPRDHSLQQATAIAEEALLHTFENAPYLSAKQFRNALHSHLMDLSVKNSANIAMSVLLLLPAEQRLTSTSTPPLSTQELIAIIEKRTLQLLAPQLGIPLAKEISQEVIVALLGSSQDNPPFSSPYALVNALKHQLHALNLAEDKKWANRIQPTFVEKLKVMTHFSEFSEKLQDPAYQYMRAFSIIYGDPYGVGKKSGGDIPI